MRKRASENKAFFTPSEHKKGGNVVESGDRYVTTHGRSYVVLGGPYTAKGTASPQYVVNDEADGVVRLMTQGSLEAMHPRAGVDGSEKDKEQG